MPSDFELAIFEQELGDVAALPEAVRWKIERDTAVPLGIFSTLYSIKNPEEIYLARLRWTKLFEPPSLKFLVLDTRAESDRRAWPKCRGFRPANLDACVSWTEEGHRLHPEWRASPKTAFKVPEKPVHFALLTLQHELDLYYDGRGS